MKQVLVRDVDDADIPAIQAIYAHHVLSGTASFEIVPPGVPDMLGRMQAVRNAGGVFLVVEKARSVVGYAYAGPYRPRAAYARTVENSIYLSADAVGAGIGSMLLSSLIEECRRKGFTQMIAVIGGATENRASIGLHRKLGFRDVGTLERVGYKFGRWLDTHIMQLDLAGDRAARIGEPGT